LSRESTTVLSLASPASKSVCVGGPPRIGPSEHFQFAQHVNRAVGKHVTADFRTDVNLPDDIAFLSNFKIAVGTIG